MKVVLLRDVAKVGRKGEIADVPQGYAHNFLIKTKAARIATASDEKHLSDAIAKAAQQEVEREKKNYELVKSLEGVSCTLARKANDTGSLFGKVTKDDVLDALKATVGATIPAEWLEDVFPIKQTGKHNIAVQFEKAKTTIVVVVEAE